MAKKHTEVHTDALPKGKEIPMGEIGRQQGIEPVSENDFVKAAELEAFMNQMLTIIVAKGSSKEMLPTAIPSVNGVNQPIIRGIPIKVKRKYVEALARCTITRYEQEVHDSSRPDQIDMVEDTSILNPFTVIEDPHPNGREWLQSIIASA